VIVGAGGRLWLDGAPVTAPELLAKSVALPPEAADADLPLRDIAGPCVVIPGQGADTYAGFVIDTLPRLLLARRAIYDTGERIRLLLDAAAPNWLARVLRVDLGFKENELERFSPQTERVRLRRAMLPGVLYGEGGFHPLVADLVYQLINRLKLPEVPVAGRLFLQRPLPQGAPADAPRSECRNEAALVALAEAQGFVPVTLDTLPWRERVARLRHARMVLFGPGANVHTLLLAGEGMRVGAIGARSTLLAEIGALRGHRMAYLSDGVPAKGPFTLPEERFAAFLAALCDPNAEAARAA
jgi:capsular polysaccharide biosynthesis protein